MAEEAVPVVLSGKRVPRPVRGLGVAEDDARPRVLVGGIAPDIELTVRRVARSAAGALKPRMLIGGMVDDQLGDDVQIEFVRGAYKSFHVAQGTVSGMDAFVVGD